MAKKQPVIQKGVTEFKLGTVMYYIWASEPPEQAQEERGTVMRTATNLLRSSWETTHDPLAGEMLMDALANGGGTGNYLKEEDKLTKALIARLAGPTAYPLYLDSKRQGWTFPPPPASLIPRNNWKPLIGVLGDRWSFLSTGFTVETPGKDGKRMQVTTHPVQNQDEQKYLQRWWESIQDALKTSQTS